MARIRTIKPEFWPDEKIGPLPPIDRLVFLGLVSQADDVGRLVDNVRLLDGLIFPLTEDTCGPSLDTLARLSLIRRGITASGQAIIQIAGWTKHQKVDKPSRKAILPPIAEPPNPNGHNDSREAREPVANDSRESSEGHARDSRYDLDLRPSTVDLRPGSEDLRAREGSAPKVDGERHPVDDFEPTQAHLMLAHERGHFVADLLTSWRLHRKANGIEPVDLDADFELWIRRERDFVNGHGNGAGGGHEPPAAVRPPLYVAPAEPDVSPEQRRAGLELVKQAVAAIPSMPPPEIDDAEVIAAREQRRRDGLRALRPEGKP